MTIKSKKKVCGMQKKTRMGLRCAIMTLKGKSKVCGMREKEQNEAGMRSNDPKK